MKSFKLFTLFFSLLTIVACTSVPVKEPVCQIDDKECHEILTYCSPLSDKKNCIEQLMNQLAEKRNSPHCSLEDKECNTAVTQCDTAFHSDICATKIVECSITSKENFQQCSQEVLCFEGSTSCSIPQLDIDSIQNTNSSLSNNQHGISEKD